MQQLSSKGREVLLTQVMGHLSEREDNLDLEEQASQKKDKMAEVPFCWPLCSLLLLRSPFSTDGIAFISKARP